MGSPWGSVTYPVIRLCANATIEMNSKTLVNKNFRYIIISDFKVLTNLIFSNAYKYIQTITKIRLIIIHAAYTNRAMNDLYTTNTIIISIFEINIKTAFGHEAEKTLPTIHYAIVLL